MSSKVSAGVVCALLINACSSPSEKASSSATSSTAPPKASANANGPAAIASAPEQETDEAGTFGSELDDHEFDAAVAVLPPEALTDPPGRAEALPKSILLTNLPSIAAQGTAKHRGYPGSCEAQSFGRALGTYTAARAADGHPLWDASKPENEVSAAFLYAWQHKLTGAKCGTGSKAVPYLSRLVSTGAPSAVDVPYRPECPYLDGSTYLEHPKEETRLRIGSFATLHIQKNQLHLLKELLADGHAIAFSGKILKGYGNPTLDHGVFYSKEVVEKGGHGQLLVGYDDTKGTEEKPGAFLVQNSEGDDWPASAPGGRIWIAYDTFLETQKLGAVAYPQDTTAPAGQLLSSKGAGNAPAASVTRAYQWEKEKNTYLVLFHHFAEPVLFKTLTLKPPKGKSVKVKLEQFIQSGYSHVRRADGKDFESGKWELTIEAETVDSKAVTYTGSVSIAAGTRAGEPFGKEIFGPTEAPTMIR